MTKYATSEYWCFAWSNGTPEPFIIPSVCADTREEAKYAACLWYGYAKTWEEIYAIGGRVVHCSVTPFQRSSRDSRARKQ